MTHKNLNIFLVVQNFKWALRMVGFIFTDSFQKLVGLEKAV